MQPELRAAIRSLLRIVARLRAKHPNRRFTLDGRLVGDLGEVLVAGAYAVELLPGLSHHHDAKTRDGRLVQIKATMQSSLTFPADHVPDYYLGIHIAPDGSFSEVFNGPGATAAKSVATRQRPKNNLHSVSLKTLTALNKSVPQSRRIPRRRSV